MGTAVLAVEVKSFTDTHLGATAALARSGVGDSLTSWARMLPEELKVERRR